MSALYGNEEISRADVLAIVPRAGKYLRWVSRLCAVQVYLLAAALQYIVEGEHAVYPPLEPVAHSLFCWANYIICLLSLTFIASFIPSSLLTLVSRPPATQPPIPLPLPPQ